VVTRFEKACLYERAFSVDLQAEFGFRFWRTGMKHFFSLLGLAVSLTLLVAQPAATQVMSYGDAVEAWAQACGADVEKFCSKVSPGTDEFASCIAQNASASCQAATAQFLANKDARLAAQAAVPDKCAFDLGRFCKGQKQGDGRLLRCLTEPAKLPKLRKSCSQALNDAGWLEPVAVRAQ
jgi:hypothetical protein